MKYKKGMFEFEKSEVQRIKEFYEKELAKMQERIEILDKRADKYGDMFDETLDKLKCAVKIINSNNDTKLLWENAVKNKQWEIDKRDRIKEWCEKNNCKGLLELI